MEIISSSVSQIARTGNGLSFAFVRLDAHGKGLQLLDTLAEYTHLRYVDISDNAVSSLAPGLTTQDYLLTLNASNNKLTLLQADVFGSKKYLQHLAVSDNAITSSDVASWPMLTKANLNRNQLTVLSMLDAPSLEVFEARENLIASIDQLQTPKLRELYLSVSQAKNQLTVLTGLDDKLALQRLHLRENQIESLSGFSAANANLTYLNLRANRIAAWTEVEKLAVLRGLAQLNLSGLLSQVSVPHGQKEKTDVDPTENPICEQDNYRLNVIYRLLQVQVLDKEPVKPEDRDEAVHLREENERQAAAATLAEEEAAAAAKRAEEEEQAAELLRQQEAQNEQAGAEGEEAPPAEEEEGGDKFGEEPENE
ncbi:hypothetical protein RI367_003022 [Sorochytrium milnesiophthora]